MYDGKLPMIKINFLNTKKVVLKRVQGYVNGGEEHLKCIPIQQIKTQTKELSLLTREY